MGQTDKVVGEICKLMCYVVTPTLKWYRKY